MERNMKLAIVAIGLVLGITFLVTILHKGYREDSDDEAQCRAVDKVPDLGDIAYFTANHNTSMASFQGYLIDKRSPSSSKMVYVPLRLKSIETTTLNDLEAILFDLNCGTIDLHLQYDGRLNEMRPIEASLEYEDASTGKLEKCLFSNTEVAYQRTEHYLCRKPRAWDCVDISSLKIVASLVVKRIEFEFNGAHGSISRGEFSKPARECA